MTMAFVRVLNVAEKNDAAKELSKILSGGQQRMREGFSKYNKIYEFPYNLFGRQCQMTMTSVSGHLLELDFSPNFRKWSSVPPGALFTCELLMSCPDRFSGIKKTLERESRGCQHLILWTDCDREGENIAFEIVDVCSKVTRNLQVHRARFSEITPQSIHRAIQQLTILDRNASAAVDARRELDLRIGCAFTRFQTRYLQRIFPSILAEQVVSYGPCQFPTLGFVVDRYKMIKAFVSEPFYKIKVTHERDNQLTEFSWKRNRVFHHTVCLILYNICLENPMAQVVSVQGRSRTKWRPTPLDTVEMEKLCSRKLKITAKETMNIAEKLYTKGFISYPRTETNIFPSSVDLNHLIQQQTQDPNWGGFAAHLLSIGPTPRQGKKTDNAHPPIHPTRYNPELQGNEKRFYELVVRHFLACCSRDAEGYETTVDIEVSGEQFYTQGLIITARNYLDVYPYEQWNAKTIPMYQQGESFEVTAIEMVEGATTPPSLLTEADLIALMEKHGIGTDATHAEHIETIKTRNYVGVRDDGCFVPGELGMGLVDGYDLMGYNLAKPFLRAQLEEDLKRICEGVTTKDAVVQSTVTKYQDVFHNTVAKASRLETALRKYFGHGGPHPPHVPGPGMPPPGPGGGGGPPGPRPFSGTTSVLGKRQPGFLDIGTKRSRIGGPQSGGRGRGTVYSSRGRGRGTATSYGSGRGRGFASVTRGGYGRGGPSLGRGTYSSRGNRGGGVGYSSWNGQQAVASGSARGGRKCSICRQEGHTKRSCPQAPPH